MGLDKMDVQIRRNRKFDKKFLKDETVQVGWFSGNKYTDGASVASVAAMLEYKSPWPFMRPCEQKNKQHWGELIKRLCQQAISEGKGIDTAMMMLGEKAKGDIQSEINSIVTPPNKPSTAKRKGFNKPLIDTGHMIGSIQSRLNTEK